MAPPFPIPLPEVIEEACLHDIHGLSLDIGVWSPEVIEEAGLHDEEGREYLRTRQLP